MKWLPAAGAAALVAALTAGGSIAAGARTDLPDRTPQDVLEMVASHEVEGFSGHLEVRVDLGLPQLPGGEGLGPRGGASGGPGARPVPGGADVDGAGPDGAGPDGEGSAAGAPDARVLELLSLLSGTHEVRVFADGHDRIRLQLLDGADETNLVRNDDELWFYDSAQDRAVHATLPRHGPRDGAPMHRWDAGALPTPEQIAERLLEGAGEHTTVTVEEGVSDSGRDAYTLRLDPRTDQTLVDGITIDIDAVTGVPLGVEVLAVDQQEPAVSIAYTRFTPEVPDGGLFEFQPPAGATVEEWSPGDGWPAWPDTTRGPAMSGPQGTGTDAPRRGDGPRPADADHHDRRGRVVGEGWGAVVVVPAAAVPRDLEASGLLDELAEDVEGGRLLGSSLVTVLLADDGRVLAGAVPPQRLLDVAADTADEG